MGIPPSPAFKPPANRHRTAAEALEEHLVDIDGVDALAAFLGSDAAPHITGTIMSVDGGQHPMD